MTNDEMRADLIAAQDEITVALGRLTNVARGLLDLAPLPAPALTEDAIVAAFKADPEMAGRVMARFADEAWHRDFQAVSGAARDAALLLSGGAYGALQSLAVALAAASYRG